jgi:predicted P-loop ATPase
MTDVLALPLDTFANQPRWVAWRPEERGGKLTKIPYGRDARRAKADDASTWLTRADAEKLAMRIVNGKGGGVGIELGDLGDGIGLAGVDLDTCLSGTTFEPWAQEIIDRFASYTETSPSGTGAKILFRYRIADIDTIRGAMGTRHGKSFARKNGDGQGHPPAIELHISNRYFAVTNQKIDTSSDELGLVDLDTLLWVIQVAGPTFIGNATKGSSTDGSRSAAAFRKGAALRRQGATFEEMVEALRADTATAAWCQEKGDERQFRRIWDKADGFQLTGWKAKAILNADRTAMVSNLFNAHLALTKAPEVQGLLGFNQMLRAHVLLKPVPRSGHDVGRFRPGPVADHDIFAIVRWLQSAGLTRISTATAAEAVHDVALSNPFHPLRRELEATAWDRKPRVETWLTYYLGCENTEYVRAIGKMFLISMVGRIFEPGCQCDYMVILEGDQGLLKTSLCRALAGPDYFSDAMPDAVESKDAAQHLRGRWLIEFAELHQFGKSAIDAIKKFLTRRTDQYRPPYARNEVVEDRQTVFIGTTNRPVYLKDETGGRRFWPVKVIKIDLDAFRHDRAQLLAEAVYLYKNGEHWWPTPEFERRYMQPEQEERFDVDPWEALIADHLNSGINRTTIATLANDPLFITDKTKLGTRESNRIIAILVRLGFRRGKRTTTERPWVRIGSEADTADAAKAARDLPAQ